MQEEKCGSKIEKSFQNNLPNIKFFFIVVEIILFIIIFFTSITFSQIPINGFCKYESFPVDSGFQSFQTLNFNKDSYTDFILFNSSQNKIASIAGKSKGELDKPKKHFNNFSISQILPITNYTHSVESYLFVSRKNKKIALGNFTSNGKIYFNMQMKFKSFPDEASIADVDNDGKKEILISGVAFDGISIIKINNHRLSEQKVVTNNFYSKALFIDFNNDSYQDIVAFNLLTSRLEFFYNNSRGEFSLIRTIPFQGFIQYLTTFDINLDFYPDIVFVTSKTINIFLNDTKSSFENQIKVTLKNEADKILFGDYNKDGKIDISYLSKKNSLVSILFQKNDLDFFDELSYLKIYGLIDLSNYYSKFIDGIAALNEKGKIITISLLSSFGSTSKLIFEGDANVLGSFDFSNDGIKDIYFIDNYSFKIYFILRNRAGIPSVFYFINLFNSYSKVKIIDSNPFTKIFYLYNEDEHEIFILTINFKNFTYTKDFLYTDGNIKDLSIQTDLNNLQGTINAAQIENGELSFTVYSYKDYHYSVVSSTKLDDKIVDVKIDSEGNFFYWKKIASTISLNKIDFSFNEIIRKKIFEVNKNKDFEQFSIFNDIYNNNQNNLLTIFNFKSHTEVFIGNEKFQRYINPTFYSDFFDSINTKKILWGKFFPKRLNKLFLYLADKKELYSFQFLRRRSKIIISKLTDDITLEKYFIERISMRNFYLIYTNQEEKCLYFKKI